MNFTVIDAPQRSEAWKLARLGRLTGSRANDMLATGRNGAESASRKNLMVQLVLERVTGRVQERHVFTDAMEDGVEREPDAYLKYEALRGELLVSTGFLQHDTLMAGCSLDGHVGDFDGLVEIKAPDDATHFGYMRTGKVPTKYLRQITHALWLTGAEWCDFMSYNPNFPERLQAHIVRVRRGDIDIAAYDAAVRKFLSEVDLEESSLRGWSVMEAV